MNADEARAILRDHSLRATGPRLSVLQVLAAAGRPLSHSEVVAKLDDAKCDPATVYRNLVKLRDAGIADVVSRASGMDRYALATGEAGQHRHPHFVCDDCGRVECLPLDLGHTMSLTGRWAASIETAEIQLRGACPDCRAPSPEFTG